MIIVFIANDLTFKSLDKKWMTRRLWEEAKGQKKKEYPKFLSQCSDCYLKRHKSSDRVLLRLAWSLLHAHIFGKTGNGRNSGFCFAGYQN
jgi:hypothetical protein